MKKYEKPIYNYVQFASTVDMLMVSQNTDWKEDPWEHKISL